MSATRFFYRWHRWSAVAVGIPTLIWFLSGVVMILPRWLFETDRAGGQSAAAELNFRRAKVTIPEAIHTLDLELGHSVQVTSVRLQPAHGRLLYTVSTVGDGSHLVDAITGERFIITEQIGREIALSAFGGTTALGEPSKIARHDSEYPWGPVPAYRFNVQDATGTSIYVGAETGEIQIFDRRQRIRAFIGNAHTLGFLRPILPSWSVKSVVLLFSFVGVIMTVLGGSILWSQFSNWLRAARRWS